jgi:hypothetical protein
MEDAKTILSRWGELSGLRSPWDASWQTISDYALPRKGNINRTETGPGTNSANRLYDTTVIEAAEILANGHSGSIAPAGTQWFGWEAPDDIKTDKADAWYREASIKAAKIMAGGNFYTALNECFVDRAAFGICSMMALPHPQKVITFQAHPVGSYCIEEDAEGNVDTVYRRACYGIRQLVQMFGEDAINANPKLAKSWEKFQSKGHNAEHHVVHGVFPRLNREPGKADKINMPIASVWVAEDGKSVLERGGYQEFPGTVSRYLKRSGRDQAYGYAPFDQVKAAVLTANKTKQIAQVVGQKMAVPPVLIPDNLVGNVDLRPGGRTVFKSGSGAGELPREWAHTGQPQWLLEQLADERETIRRVYHVDLFRMFADREKMMTAREVTELAAEKLMQFSPSFTLFTADFATLMNRVFGILFRAGVFGLPQDIPAEVIRQTTEGPEVPQPKTVYQSRFALAIRQVQTAAGDRLVERALQVAQVAPEAMDNIDLDAYLRESGRNDGAAEKILRPVKERDAMREARAAAQQEQAQMMQAAEMAKAAGSLGVQV